MQQFSKWNKGYRYLLMVIDVFSKYGWIGAYGKHGNLDPEPEPESGTGTGTGTGNGTGIGEINECFKLGSMIHIKTPPPFSAFLARWMMIRGTLLRKGTCT